MEIYIEIFLLENILINFCLIKLIHSTTKNKTKFLKMLIASIVGSISSIFSIFYLNNNLILNIVKLLTALSMILVAFKQTKKQFITNTILLFLYTYAFGGLITNLGSSTHYTSFGTFITNKFSLEIICLLIIVSTYIFDLVLRHIKLKIQTNNLIYKIKLTQGNKSININAYLDTGNFINHNGKPVLILDLNTYLKLTKINLVQFLSKKTETINTTTVNGNNALKLFTIDKVEILNQKYKKEIKNQLIAINLTNCFKNTNYEALLSPLFI